jgi:hypothetical protein
MKRGRKISWGRIIDFSTRKGEKMKVIRIMIRK